MDTSAINVNLTPCEYPELHAAGAFHTCRGGEVLIPCPIPRSVTFHVALGKCTCSLRHYADMAPHQHTRNCPARPIRVTGSVWGKDWAISELSAAVPDVTDAWPNERPVTTGGELYPELLRIARHRWALVKALVLGHTDLSALLTGPKAVQLLTQRDAVFAALADQTRLEQAAFEAYERAMKALGEPAFYPAFSPDSFIRAEAARRASAGLLERYVDRLIEQVGVLGVP